MHCPVGLQTLHLPVASRPHQPASPSAYNVSAHTLTVPTTPLYAAPPTVAGARATPLGVPCLWPCAWAARMAGGEQGDKRTENMPHLP